MSNRVLRVALFVSCFLTVSFQVSLRADTTKQSDKSKQKTQDVVPSNAPVGEKILRDKTFFSEDFAKKTMGLWNQAKLAGIDLLESDVPGGEEPAVKGIRDKYGDPDQTEERRGGERTEFLKKGPPFNVVVYWYGQFGFAIPKDTKAEGIPERLKGSVVWIRLDRRKSIVKADSTGAQPPISGSQGSSPIGTTRVQIPSFVDMDKDKNGKVSREEFPGPPQLFDRFDETKDNVVTEEEYTRFRQRMLERSRQKQERTEQQSSKEIQEKEKSNKSEKNPSEPAAKPDHAADSSQNYRGFEITLLAVERKNELKVQGLTTTYVTLKAKDGYEFVVVRVRVESKGPGEETIQDLYGRVKRLETIDFQDKAYSLDSKEAEIEGTKSIWQLNFIVPKGIRLKTLRFEDLSFDLERF